MRWLVGKCERSNNAAINLATVYSKKAVTLLTSNCSGGTQWKHLSPQVRIPLGQQSTELYWDLTRPLQYYPWPCVSLDYLALLITRVQMVHCFFKLPSGDMSHLVTFAKSYHKSTPSFKEAGTYNLTLLPEEGGDLWMALVTPRVNINVLSPQ
jgi:hypothetical protein